MRALAGVFQPLVVLVWAIAQATVVAGEEPDRISQLLGDLGHDLPEVRTAAALQLADTGDPRAVDAVARLLADGEVRVDWWVVEAIGRVGASAGDRLVAALGSEDSHVRFQAKEALRRMAAPGVERLIAALDSDESVVRVEAAMALSDIGDRRAVPALAALARDEEPDVRLKAVAAVHAILYPRDA